MQLSNAKFSKPESSPTLRPSTLRLQVSKVKQASLRTISANLDVDLNSSKRPLLRHISHYFLHIHMYFVACWYVFPMAYSLSYRYAASVLQHCLLGASNLQISFRCSLSFHTFPQSRITIARSSEISWSVLPGPQSTDLNSDSIGVTLIQPQHVRQTRVVFSVTSTNVDCMPPAS